MTPRPPTEGTPESGPPIPGDGIPELPAVFVPSVGPSEPKLSRAGCGSPLTMSCGCLLVLLAGLVAMFLLKADDFVHWWLGQAERMVVEGLPADVDEPTRQRLSAAFDGVDEALQNGRGEAGAIARMQSELGSAVRKAGSGTLTQADVLRLIQALESVAGQDPAPVLSPSAPVIEAQRSQTMDRGFMADRAFDRSC